MTMPRNAAHLGLMAARMPQLLPGSRWGGLQIAGGVTMNNTMCLGLFLLVVWYKGLEWTYTSEVIATVGE